MEAGRIYERAGKLEQAADLWESLPNKYPSDGSILDALFQAGIVRYRLGNYPAALQDFQRSLGIATETTDKARMLLWIGKTYQAAGDQTNATSAWQQAQALDATSYYSVRARDILNNRAPFTAPPSMNLDYNLGQERDEAAAWVRVQFNIPAGTNLSDPASLSADPRLQRGTEFWQMGLYDQARLEFEDLREAVKTNAADSFRLGNYLLDIGAYRPAIFALRQVLTLAGMDDHSESLTAPIYFKHVRYGLYFSDIIWASANENAIDPLFLTSLVRQESLFEGFVHSTAGARGLMQIIPTTGANIARQMGWPPNYSDDDLYSPYISLRMGAYYLSANRSLLNGDMYATLAAYNGGPGNAQIWQSLANNDPDLQLEVIRFYETRDYIRSIYETYSIYRSLYSPMQ
jgi:soluble lytic murein transglycosylase